MYTHYTKVDFTLFKVYLASLLASTLLCGNKNVSLLIPRFIRLLHTAVSR